jgi:hypothetical protein
LWCFGLSSALLVILRAFAGDLFVAVAVGDLERFCLRLARGGCFLRS